MVDGPSAVNGTTEIVRASGTVWTTTLASGSFTSSSIVWAESLVSSLTASIPPKVNKTISSMAT